LYRLPDVAPTSTVSLLVHAKDERFGDITFYPWLNITILPKIFPSMRLNEIAVNQGESLTVTGDHWLPGQQGVIEYCRGQSPQPGIVGLRCGRFVTQQLGVFQADSNGHFVAHVQMPTDARFGSVTVQARVPYAAFGLGVYAQAQGLTIIPTYVQAHPRREWVIDHAWYLGGGAIALLALGGALAAWLTRARRRRSGAQPAA
jgi:hypothetical protein